MPRTLPPTPRTLIAELIADLRDSAEDTASDLEGIPAHETTEGEAAQALEEMSEALSRISGGEANPQSIAQSALSLAAPLKPIGAADDSIKKLLNPRRT